MNLNQITKFIKFKFLKKIFISNYHLKFDHKYLFKIKLIIKFKLITYKKLIINKFI